MKPLSDAFRMIVNPAMAATEAPPVMEARRWIADVTFPEDRPLLNVSQAAPVEPPPEQLRRAIAETALNVPEAHLYGPVLGLPELRAEVATQSSGLYGGSIRDSQVAITSGCNQAFVAAISTLAGAGDEVILPTPWYFNHKMWLDMTGIRTVPLATGLDHLPDPESARALISDKTKALVLVTPNNPAGVEYPSDLIAAFRDLARESGIALIIDETYRDFHSASGAPHDLFTDPNWDDTLIQMYSFSKSYRLTGHRVGALVASQARLSQVEKFLDTVAICPPQLGQRAALWGMQNLSQWLAGERAEILDRRAAIDAAISDLPDWQLLTSGAYFAYLKHPFDERSDDLARRMVRDASILALPGTMFMPKGDPMGAACLRIAFANIDRSGIQQLVTRLAALS